MLDFEEFRFLAANACVAVTATKSVATATTTTTVITLLRCIEGLSYFIILVTRRYSKIYELSNSLVYFNLCIIYWNDYRELFVYFKGLQIFLTNLNEYLTLRHIPPRIFLYFFFVGFCLSFSCLHSNWSDS
jgi:hypothetical protein